ncbi:hypothetical protein ScPMuIL_017234 [Solemya velum]
MGLRGARYEVRGTSSERRTMKICLGVCSVAFLSLLLIDYTEAGGKIEFIKKAFNAFRNKAKEDPGQVLGGLYLVDELVRQVKDFKKPEPTPKPRPRSIFLHDVADMPPSHVIQKNMLEEWNKKEPEKKENTTPTVEEVLPENQENDGTQ